MLRVLTLIATLAAGAAGATPWVLLPETAVTVDVPWRGLTVALRFPDVDGSVEFDESNPESARARIAVASTTATTGLPPADRVARSAEFLAADSFPSMAFTLDRLVRTSRSTADVRGVVTFRGVSRPILFRATVLRYGPGTDGRFEAGFRLEGTIDRTEFGATGAAGEIPAVLPVRIDLMMASAPP
jgi:polyisoprenoid-binding protein YceI